ncbi:MAG: MFS transporter [Candidatus Sumerlaeia bacterium]|nr:MFS transporter [Candidatus Sumerlaeia bacterium]
MSSDDSSCPRRPPVRRTAGGNELRRALRLSNIEATFAVIHMALTQGMFLGTYQGVVLTNYIIDLGGSNFICGLVQALPYLSQIAFILSPWVVRRLNGRRPVVVWFSLASRLAWALLIAYVFLPLSPGLRQALLVATLLLSNISLVVAGNAWLGWMADLVPVGIRGAFYGRRNVYLWIAAMVSVFLGAQALTLGDWFGDRRIGYVLCFGIASLAAMVSAYVLSHQYEPPLAAMTHPSRRRMWAHLLSNVPFTRYLQYSVVWQFSVGLAEAFFAVHMVRVLKMSPAQMGVQALISALMAVVSVRAWGRALDRAGSKAVLMTTGLIVALHVWLWCVARPDMLWPVWLAAVLAGFAWSGYNLAAFNWPQLMTGSAERQHALGLLNSVSGLTYLAAALLGGAASTLLPQTLFHIGPYEVVHFHMLFAVSAIGRLTAIVVFARRVPYATERAQSRRTLELFARALQSLISPRRTSNQNSFAARVLRQLLLILKVRETGLPPASRPQQALRAKQKDETPPLERAA